MLDNYEFHASLETILFCRDNEIHFLTFPAHCTHRMLLLDVGRYGSLKTFLKDRLLANTGRRISIYEIAELTGKAYNRKHVFCIQLVCGIVPFDRQGFSRDCFVGIYVCCRPTYSVRKFQ